MRFLDLTPALHLPLLPHSCWAIYRTEQGHPSSVTSTKNRHEPRATALQIGWVLLSQAASRRTDLDPKKQSS